MMNAPESLQATVALNNTPRTNSSAAPSVQQVGLPSLEAPPQAVAGKLTLSKHPLHDVETQVRVALGDIHMTVSQLLSLRQGEVFSLDHAIDAPVDVMVKDHVVARGILVAVEDFYGVQITEIPTPLSLAG